ncbi:hypothetical protein SRDD_32300 [Serratia sp. DD3]|nr:hypothetical protein SRDD_32300 [Serratia sp. DD3]
MHRPAHHAKFSATWQAVSMLDNFVHLGLVSLTLLTLLDRRNVMKMLLIYSFLGRFLTYRAFVPLYPS